MTGQRTEVERIFVFEMDMPIRWGDMDAMGHVNNTVYFRYMEQLRISWFDAMGLGSNPAGEGPIIVNAHCSFIRELRYPGTVRCRHYTGKIGRSSFETHAVLSRTDDPETVYAEGGAKVVWVDHPKRKSVPLPERVRRAIVTPLRPPGWRSRAGRTTMDAAADRCGRRLKAPATAARWRSSGTA